MATIDVKDAADLTVAIEKPLAPGRANATVSRPVAVSNEDFAEIQLFNTRAGSVTETAPTNDTNSSGLNGRLQRIAQRITSLIALVPTSLGSKAAASSLAVTLSTEDLARLGATNETAPATDTDTAGHNARLQRVAQNITALGAQLTTLLGHTDALETKLDTLNTSIVSATLATVAHDAAAASINSLLTGSHASAARPAAVNADNDAVRTWLLRTGETVIAQIGLTYVDASIANAAGTSEQIVAASTTRRYLKVANPSASVSWWINPSGGTAAANTAGSFELLPRTSWVPMPPPINAVTGIATATTDLTVVSA